MGTSYCYSFLRDRFHLSDLIDSDNDYAPLAIGDMGRGVTPLDMCAAYLTFGNGGLYYTPYCYYEVKDADGNVLLKPEKKGQQVLSPGTADVMNHLLQCPVTYSNGTAKGYGVSGFTTFAKTGTSSNNYDKWIVGGTPYYVCSTWVGFKVRKEIKSYIYGQYPAAQVFKTVMNRVHEDLDDKDFEYGTDAVRRTFCTRSGLLASSSCWSTSTGWYKIDNLPGTCSACAGGYYDDYGDELPDDAVDYDYVGD